MSITRRRFTTLGAAAAGATALGALATGCGEGGGSGGGGGDSFTYWSMWQTGEDQQKVLADEIDKFTAETGITVDVQWSGREVLGQVVPRLNAGNPPDLIDNGSPDLQSKIGLENLLPIADVYDMEILGEEGTTIADVVPEALLSTMQNEDGEAFMVPYEVIGSTLWFNAAVSPVFAKEPPATWEDLVGQLETLKGEGRTPIALDGDIADYCAYWLEWGILRAGGAGTMLEAVQDASGEAFEGPAWTVATDNVEALLKVGFFPEGFQGTKFPTQQASWADQTSKTDLILMGSWLPSETTASITQSGGDPASLEFGSFPFPSVGEDAGAGLAIAQPIGFAIPATARKPEPAKKFMTWMLNKERLSRIATEAKNLTPRTDVEAPPELAGFAEEYAGASETVLFADGISVAEPQWVTDTWQPAVIDLFGGKLSAAEFRARLAKETVAYHEGS